MSREGVANYTNILSLIIFKFSEHRLRVNMWAPRNAHCCLRKSVLPVMLGSSSWK